MVIVFAIILVAILLALLVIAFQLHNIDANVVQTHNMIVLRVLPILYDLPPSSAVPNLQEDGVEL